MLKNICLGSWFPEGERKYSEHSALIDYGTPLRTDAMYLVQPRPQHWPWFPLTPSLSERTQQASWGKVRTQQQPDAPAQVTPSPPTFHKQPLRAKQDRQK